MDRMNLFVMSFVSFPGALLNVAIGFLLMGYKDFLKPSVVNIKRMVLTILLMIIADYFIRAYTPLAIASLLQILVYILIIKFTCEITIKKSLTCVSLFTGVLISIELIYAPTMLVYLQKSLYQVYSDDTLRLICSIPERLIQLGVCISLWNTVTVFVDFKKYKGMLKYATAVLMLLYSIEIIFMFTFMYNIDKMDLLTKILDIIVSIGFVVFNSLIFKFISAYSRTVLKTEKEKHDISNRRIMDEFAKLFAD